MQASKARTTVGHFARLGGAAKNRGPSPRPRDPSPGKRGRAIAPTEFRPGAPGARRMMNLSAAEIAPALGGTRRESRETRL